MHWVSIAVLLVGIYLVWSGQPPMTVTAFDGMFVRDRMAEILKVFALGTTAIVFVLRAPVPARSQAADRRVLHR